MRLVERSVLSEIPYDKSRRGRNGGAMVPHPFRKLLDGISVGQLVELKTQEWNLVAEPSIAISGWFHQGKTDKQFRTIYTKTGWIVERIK